MNEPQTQNRPSGQAGAVGVQAGEPNDSCSNSTGLVGHTVERQLDAALWRLVTGEIGLHDCTSALRGWYSIGFAHGQDSTSAQLEQAESDRDRLYEIAYHGMELPDVRLRRMRAGADEYWVELMASGDPE